MMFAKVRLYLTAAKDALVSEGDPKGAFLYCAPGDEIPDSAAEKFGLVDGDLPDAGGKERKPRENKERKGGGDKGGQGGGAKTDDPKQLTSIKGIGEATAAKLVAAGVVDVAALAAVDPATPPAIEGLPPAFDWAAVVALAKEAQPAAEAGAEG